MASIESTVFFDVGHGPTRTVEVANTLHQIADTNFQYMIAMVRGIAPEAIPSLRDVYLGSSRIACAPASLGLKVLFKRFNDIARASFIAHSSLDDELNALIFYYGFDKQHSFSMNLDRSHINIALVIYTMASCLVGRYSDTDYNKRSFWSAYALAWIESLTLDSNFKLRTDFLANWRASSNDLVWFGNADKRRMDEVLSKLSAGKPPVQGNPLKFLGKCLNGKISEEEFLRVGPAMAIHFMIAYTKNMADSKRVAKAEEMDVEMTIDSDPSDVALECVDWDDKGIQALINIDRTIEKGTAGRPDSDRKGWIDASDAYRILISEGDDLAAMIKTALCIN